MVIQLANSEKEYIAQRKNRLILSDYKKLYLIQL
jgi:hypothetical protein